MSNELPAGATPKFRSPALASEYRSGPDWQKYSNFANEVLGPFTGQRKAGDGMAEYYKELARRPFGGGKSSGRSETLADGSLTALYPDSFEPIIFPGGGGGGGGGGKSTAGRLAGAATGALSGAAAGSAVPGIGTAIGAVLGGLGGLFG